MTKIKALTDADLIKQASDTANQYMIDAIRMINSKLGAKPRLLDLSPKGPLHVFEVTVPINYRSCIIIHAPVSTAPIALHSPRFRAELLHHSVFVAPHPTQGAPNQSFNQDVTRTVHLRSVILFHRFISSRHLAACNAG